MDKYERRIAAVVIGFATCALGSVAALLTNHGEWIVVFDYAVLVLALLLLWIVGTEVYEQKKRKKRREALRRELRDWDGQQEEKRHAVDEWRESSSSSTEDMGRKD